MSSLKEDLTKERSISGQLAIDNRMLMEKLNRARGEVMLLRTGLRDLLHVIDRGKYGEAEKRAEEVFAMVPQDQDFLVLIEAFHRIYVRDGGHRNDGRQVLTPEVERVQSGEEVK